MSVQKDKRKAKREGSSNQPSSYSTLSSIRMKDKSFLEG